MDFALDAHPSEQELIMSYLSPRVISGEKSSKFIHEGDVYAAHPADLTREYAAAVSSNGDEAWYFFTAVRARGGCRRSRTVDSGEGCWHSEAGSKPVDSAHHGDVGYRHLEGLVEESSPADEPEVEDRDDFFWWLRNKDKAREEIGISKEDFYQHIAPSVWEWVMDYFRHTAAPRPVVRSEDEPVVMWLTFDELYNLPEVREFLSSAKVLEEMRGSSAKNEQISR
ncbi:hypothetical protein ACQ4PT_007193 [Festuca glaucescens]